MLTISIIFFALAALIGLTMAYRFYGGKPVPFILPVFHALMAVPGLLLLIIAWSQLQAGSLVAPIIVFVVAAAGGLFLVSFHLRGHRPPPAVIVVHGLLAVTGFILLLSAAAGISG